MIRQPVPGTDGQIHLDIVVTEIENQMITNQVLFCCTNNVNFVWLKLYIVSNQRPELDAGGKKYSSKLSKEFSRFWWDYIERYQVCVKNQQKFD